MFGKTRNGWLAQVFFVGTAAAAFGQQIPTAGYRLYSLGGGADLKNSRGFDLNDAGVVVGQVQLNALPQPDKYLAAFWPDPIHAPNSYIAIGGSTGAAVSINHSGQIAGHNDEGNFLRQPDGGISFEYFGEVTAVNNLGYVVGVHSSIASLWTPQGAQSQVGGLGLDNFGTARDINDSGWIVGEAEIPTELRYIHPFISQAGSGVVTDLGTLGGAGEGRACGINDAGQVVGQAADPALRSIAFVWDSVSGMRSLGSLIGPTGPGAASYARDINDQGLIVGGSTRTPGPGFVRATIWDVNGPHDLNTLIRPLNASWNLQEANAINESGWIIAVGSFDVLSQRAVLLVPICTGDLNGDQTVNLLDLGIMLSAYGLTAGGDIDGDGDTDLTDLGALLSAYGQPC